MTPKQTTYVVYLRGEIEVGVKIKATSLEDAFIKAQGIRVGTEILQDDVSYNDGGLEVVGVIR